MIAIKPSQIHGNGVFALQDIPQNKFITLYPDDYKISNKMTETLKGTKFEPYILTIDEHTNIYGDPDSKDLTKCGHIINDGYKPKIPQNSTDLNWVKCCIDYYIHSTRIANVDLKQKISSVQVIKKDTELFTTYGYPYWVSTLTKKHAPFITLATSHILNQQSILDFIREFDDVELLENFLLSLVTDKLQQFGKILMNSDED